jgi:hypothetical protein
MSVGLSKSQSQLDAGPSPAMRGRSRKPVIARSVHAGNHARHLRHLRLAVLTRLNHDRVTRLLLHDQAAIGIAWNLLELASLLHHRHNGHALLGDEAVHGHGMLLEARVAGIEAHRMRA